MIVKIIIIAFILLSACSALLIPDSHWLENDLADRMAHSQNYYSYIKSMNKSIQKFIQSGKSERDSLRKDRAKHFFDYPFLRKYNHKPTFKANDSLYKSRMEQLSLFKKFINEFPEYKKLSTNSRMYVFKRAYRELNDEHKELSIVFRTSKAIKQ